ncbi:short chain dehydrogenase [Teratosphaeria nubilosa]|uniref:Short chain dehydrogenase n=1 Tax=Teratosphaeria nubilosa TaxID=161662 RepID=A0A6G1KYL5_9PEZI|nr:short chain dehydrogenase [Teratosphaeria nubilosa]
MPHAIDHYVSVNENPNGPGDARPTAEAIIKDEGLVGKLTDKVMFVTGGTAGLGKETARVLRMTGARVYINARDASKGEKVAKEISTEGEHPPVKVIEMDLSSLASIRKGAADFLAQEPTLNVLITNAGVMACASERTADGFEMQFGTNHLGHFLLFNLLKPALLAAATPELPSRFISLSSAGHRRSNIRPDIGYDLIKSGEYDPWVAYGQSKTANILFANEVDKRYAGHNLRGLSVHPGVILETELSRHQEGGGDGLREKLSQGNPGFKKIEKSVGQGAATQVWAAVAESLKGKGGLYLEDVKISQRMEEGKQAGAGGKGHMPYVYDEENATRLWSDSARMVGVDGE